jgi:hypothetical protein
VWESNFRQKVDAVRQRELKSLRAVLFCDAGVRMILNLVPILVSVVTFLVHTQV